MAGQGKVWSQHGDHISQGQPWSHYGTKSPRITEGKDLQYQSCHPPDRRTRCDTTEGGRARGQGSAQSSDHRDEVTHHAGAGDSAGTTEAAWARSSLLQPPPVPCPGAAGDGAKVTAQPRNACLGPLPTSPSPEQGKQENREAAPAPLPGQKSLPCLLSTLSLNCTELHPIADSL